MALADFEVSYEGYREAWEWPEGEQAERPEPSGEPVQHPALKIVDTTLRDGEQTAGVVFSNAEKLEIARLLDAGGVHQIEAGVPVMGGDEQEAIRAIVGAGLRASVMGWNRAVISDIDASIESGLDAVCISVSVSDIHIKNKLGKTRQWVLDHMLRTIDYAKSHGLYVSANGEDASRAEMEFLLEFIRRAKDAGADRFRFCDTVGCLGPFQTYEKIRTIVAVAGLPVEMHCHNDFGMAAANTIAGLRAGASFAGVTVTGLGERAGNAALEEVVMALKHIERVDARFNYSMIRQLCEYVAQAAGRAISPSKPIVGSGIFMHESGVHADGVLKHPETYEPFAPSDVGGVRQLVIGKHSGRASIKAKFAEFGISVADEHAVRILEEVRRKAVELKRPLFDKELMYIYYNTGGTAGRGT